VYETYAFDMDIAIFLILLLKPSSPTLALGVVSGSTIRRSIANDIVDNIRDPSTSVVVVTVGIDGDYTCQ
jgi:hypothetical protein